MNPLLRVPVVLFDFAVFLTGNLIEAWRFYHEMSLEVLDLLR